jgi:RNA polymerase sigma factor (sigma-70 family)
VVSSSDRGTDDALHGALLAEMLPRVRAFARAHLRNPVDAEDFAQEAMALTISALREGRIERPDRVGGWVLGACRNLLRADWRRTQRRQRLSALATAGEPRAVDPPEPGDPWYRLVMCLARLREDARRVLQSTFVDDLDSPEIARVLELTASNVRVMRKRALAVLRRCMEGEEDRA